MAAKSKGKARAATKPPRRPWGSLDQDQIVAAALKIAREEGIPALSIRRLAEELGASRMALYRHVEDKEALLDLAANAIAFEHDLPLPVLEDTEWEEQLRTLMRGVRMALVDYPGLAELLLFRGSGSPATLAIANRCIGILRRAGLDGKTAARCYVALFDVVFARAQRETAAGAAGPEKRLRRQLAATEATDPATIPHLIEVHPSFRQLTAEEIAETELDLLIAGVRALAREARGVPRKT